MNTTWDLVRAYLESHCKLVHERGDQWRGSSPLRPGSDGNTFVLKIAPDGEHGTFFDHKEESDKGSLYQLAEKLNIPIQRKYHTIVASKHQYHGLKDYAEAHGAPMEAYKAALWSETPVTIKNRPALEFQTRGGKRWRFLDGQKPSFISQPGYVQCWYGLDKAVAKAKETGQPLVLCNGEPSVIVGDYWGVAACTITSGEKGEFPTPLLDHLKALYTGKVIIALDCDYTGMKAAFNLSRQLESLHISAVAIDLGLGEGGDLADFCKLHESGAVETLALCKPLEARALPPEQLTLPDAVTPMNLDDLYCSDIDALNAYVSELKGDVTPTAPPLVNPFTFLHKVGGLGRIIPAGKLVFLASISAGTKTIGFETGWETCQDNGVHSIVYSPEWVDGESNAVEFAARAIQRAGGANFNDWLSNRLYQHETTFNHQNGMATPLEPHEVGKSVSFAMNLMRRPGRVFYIKQPGLSAEALCAAVQAICEREAKNGIIIRALWCDFAQLLWLQKGSESGRVWMETAINLIKDTCRQKNLVGFISSQMNKSEAELVKTGGKFDSGQMQFLSEQQCNFLFAFAPKYENGKPVTIQNPDYPGQKIGLLRGKVLKNSLAEVSEAEIEIPVNFSRLIWMNGKVR